MEMNCHSSLSEHICLLSLMPKEGLILKLFDGRLLKDLHLGYLKAIINISGAEQQTTKLHLLLEMSNWQKDLEAYDLVQYGITYAC